MKEITIRDVANIGMFFTRLQSFVSRIMKALTNDFLIVGFDYLI